MLHEPVTHGENNSEEKWLVAGRNNGQLMLIPFIPKPEFDIYRVDAIRSQLDEDMYFVNPQQIADKFIDLETALPGNS